MTLLFNPSPYTEAVESLERLSLYGASRKRCAEVIDEALPELWATGALCDRQAAKIAALEEEIEKIRGRK